MTKEDENYPDPCDYCSRMYLNNNCSADCEDLKEAAEHWARGREMADMEEKEKDDKNNI